MKIKEIHVRQMTLWSLFKVALEQSWRVFRLSIPGNVLILLVITGIFYQTSTYVESFGVSEKVFNGVLIYYNIFFVSFTSANIFYLLTISSDKPYMAQVKEALVKTLKIFPTLLFTVVLYCLLFSLGLLFFLIPGMLLYVFFGLFTPVIVFEKKGIFTSLIRSASLVSRGFGKIFISFLIISVITYLGALFIGAFIEGFLYALPTLGSMLSNLSYVVFMPLIGCFYAQLYFDLRLKGEFFDFEILEQEVNEAKTGG